MLPKLWIQMRSSLWFVPTLLVVAAGGTAIALVNIDIAFADRLSGKSWQPLLNAGAEGARGMLTAIATSMITVAGVTFSITIVTLSLASTQYTPRILRNFMRDRANQFVLGTFVAIFTYCLLVLRTIRGGAEHDGGGFVPLLSVAFGMLLAVLSIGCLIFFIHHIAASIQASYILNAITTETSRAIDNLFPHQLDGEDTADAVGEPRPSTAGWHSIAARTSGYVQGVNGAELLRLAREHQLSVHLERVPGDFVVEGAPLMSADRPLKEDDAGKWRELFAVGDFRTVEKDVGFGIRQIVDIAMKALSPGVNDTSTAVSCLDYLSVLLCQLANRKLVPAALAPAENVQVTAALPSFADLAAKAFDEVRLSAQSNVTIILQMLCALRRVVSATSAPARKRALMEQARVIVESADCGVRAPYDRARINRGIAELRDVLAVSSSELPALAAVRAGGGTST